MAGFGRGLDLSSYGSQIMPEDKDQFVCKTPYGEALVVRTIKNEFGLATMLEYELTDWNKYLNDDNNNGSNDGNNSPKKTYMKKGPRRPATLYSPILFPSIEPTVDCQVVTPCGRGRVIGIRRDNSKAEVYVVKLTNWRLANRGTVTGYYRRDSLKVVRNKKLYEMNVYEKVELAEQLKLQASKEFSKKQYAAALTTYSKAIDAVRYIQHQKDSDNYVRGDLLKVMVTCSNNAATCSKQMGQWDSCLQFAKNAEVLLNALLNQKGKKIHKVLNTEGFLDSKLFGEWRVKSLILEAWALAEKQETKQAIEILTKAHAIIAEHNNTNTANYEVPEKYKKQHQASIQSLVTMDKEVKRLHTTCKERRKLELKKEKQRAQAMFGGGAAAAASSVSTSTPSPTKSNGKAPQPPSSSSYHHHQEEKKETPDEVVSASTDASAAAARRSVSFSDDVKVHKLENNNYTNNKGREITNYNGDGDDGGFFDNFGAAWPLMALAGVALIGYSYLAGGGRKSQ